MDLNENFLKSFSLGFDDSKIFYKNYNSADC